jgi:preprotein translocase subunit SecE
MSEQVMSEQDTREPIEPQQPRALGLERWVQMAFVVFTLAEIWVLDRVISIVWDKFAEPPPELVTLVAAVISGALTYVLYRNAKVSRIAHEVVGELAKVSWPSRKETQISTIVVIITSLIAAVIVGAFDAAWSAITDLIYKV